MAFDVGTLLMLQESVGDCVSAPFNSLCFASKSKEAGSKGDSGQSRRVLSMVYVELIVFLTGVQKLFQKQWPRKGHSSSKEGWPSPTT